MLDSGPGRAHRVTLIPGDGIGPEVTAAARRVIDASGCALDWQLPIQAESSPLDEGDLAAALESIRSTRIALKGPITTAATGKQRSLNVALRRDLDLYVQVRPSRSLRGVPVSHANVDLVTIRETTEDLYAGIEFDAGHPHTDALVEWMAERGAVVASGAGISIKFLSEPALRRMLQFAIQWARNNHRRRITVVHKATVMRSTDGMFLEVAREVASSCADVEFDDCLVDSLAARLVQRPDTFDVLVMPNQYGDIISDIAAALTGGVGLAPGANFGDRVAVFESAHGSAPRLGGQDRANPAAMMRSGAMMLHHLGEHRAADRVERALANVVEEGSQVTCDLRPGRAGGVGTQAMADAVIARMT